MSGDSPKAKNTASSLLLGFVAAVLILVLAIVTAAVSAGKLTINGWKRTTREEKISRVLSSAKWEVRRISDLSVETPFPLVPVRRSVNSLPLEERELISSSEEVSSDGSPSEFYITVSRLSLREGVVLGVADAIDGAITEAARAVGDTAPKYSAWPVRVSGLEGRRASYSLNREGPEFHMAVLEIQRGKVNWHVQVLYSYASASSAAARVLESVKIVEE